MDDDFYTPRRWRLKMLDIDRRVDSWLEGLPNDSRGYVPMQTWFHDGALGEETPKKMHSQIPQILKRKPPSDETLNSLSSSPIIATAQPIRIIKANIINIEKAAVHYPPPAEPSTSASGQPKVQSIPAHGFKLQNSDKLANGQPRSSKEAQIHGYHPDSFFERGKRMQGEHRSQNSGIVAAEDQALPINRNAVGRVHFEDGTRPQHYQSRLSKARMTHTGNGNYSLCNKEISAYYQKATGQPRVEKKTGFNDGKILLSNVPDQGSPLVSYLNKPVRSSQEPVLSVRPSQYFKNPRSPPKPAEWFHTNPKEQWHVEGLSRKPVHDVVADNIKKETSPKDDPRAQANANRTVRHLNDFEVDAGAAEAFLAKDTSSSKRTSLRGILTSATPSSSTKRLSTSLQQPHIPPRKSSRPAQHSSQHSRRSIFKLAPSEASAHTTTSLGSDRGLVLRDGPITTRHSRAKRHTAPHPAPQTAVHFAARPSQPTVSNPYPENWPLSGPLNSHPPLSHREKVSNAPNPLGTAPSAAKAKENPFTPPIPHFPTTQNSAARCRSLFCPIKRIPHKKGPYLHGGKLRSQPEGGEVFGSSNPPPEIWEAYERIKDEDGKGGIGGRRKDQVAACDVNLVRAFVKHHFGRTQVFEEVKEEGEGV